MLITKCDFPETFVLRRQRGVVTRGASEVSADEHWAFCIPRGYNAKQRSSTQVRSSIDDAVVHTLAIEIDQ